MAANHFKDTLTLVSKSSSTETEDTAPACAEDENVPQQVLELRYSFHNTSWKMNPKRSGKKIMGMYTQVYPIMAQIINILRIFPFSNAIVERCFSAMKKSRQTDEHH